MDTRNPHLASKLAFSLLVLVGALAVLEICWDGEPPAIRAQDSLVYDVASTSADCTNPDSLYATVPVTADQYTYLPLIFHSHFLRYVATSGTDSGDCTDPNHPCATVQYAVDQAYPYDEIRVAAGVYTDVQGRQSPPGYFDPYYFEPTPGEIITQVVYISKSVSIRGGYSAEPERGTTAFTDPPDPVANPTTLDAGGQGRVLFITGNVNPTIEGLRITGGDAAGLGGGISLYFFWPRIDTGGGVYVYGAAPLLRNNQVFSNTAPCGGGLYLYNSATTLSGNIISTNTATASGCLIPVMGTAPGDKPAAPPTPPRGGGGLYLDGGSVTLSKNDISANTTAGFGGGLCLLRGFTTLRGNTIAANTASYGGGGLHAWASDPTLDGNVITANAGGGVSLVGAGYLTDEARLRGNTIMANSGGGLFLWNSAATMINDVVADNQASFAGSGLWIGSGGTHGGISHPHLSHTTIAGNRGSGGIYITGEHTTVSLINTILVSHTVGIVVPAGYTATLEGTLWGVGAWANGTDWGGGGTVVTGTVNVWGAPDFVDPAGGDYHIGPGSAAIDAGVDAGVTTDMDGDPRPAGAGYDIGADERAEP